MPLVPTGDQNPIGLGRQGLLPEDLIGLPLVAVGVWPRRRTALRVVIVTGDDGHARDAVMARDLDPLGIDAMRPGTDCLGRFSRNAARRVVGVNAIEDARGSRGNLIADKNRA